MQDAMITTALSLPGYKVVPIDIGRRNSGSDRVLFRFDDSIGERGQNAEADSLYRRWLTERLSVPSMELWRLRQLYP